MIQSSDIQPGRVFASATARELITVEFLDSTVNPPRVTISSISKRGETTIKSSLPNAVKFLNEDAFIKLN